MFLLKSCPRCRRGDLIVEHDEFGVVVDCLQCGYAGDERSVQRSVSMSPVMQAAPQHEKVTDFRIAAA